MPPADAPGFCKEICRFQRPKSGAVNAKTKSILAFTIFISLTIILLQFLRLKQYTDNQTSECTR